MCSLCSLATLGSPPFFSCKMKNRISCLSRLWVAKRAVKSLSGFLRTLPKVLRGWLVPPHRGIVTWVIVMWLMHVSSVFLSMCEGGHPYVPLVRDPALSMEWWKSRELSKPWSLPPPPTPNTPHSFYSRTLGHPLSRPNLFHRVAVSLTVWFVNGRL